MTKTDAEKSAAKAKKTRKANLLLKGKEREKHERALKRASIAEKELKAFKEGVKYAVDVLGGKI